MNTSPLVFLARRVSTILEPRFGRERAEDRAANMITGVACDALGTLEPDEIAQGVKKSIEVFRQDHCGGFHVSDQEVEKLTKDALTIILEELPLMKL